MAIENKEKISGIYLIINKINNKFYIGSTRNLSKRAKEHRGTLNNNKHCNKYLQNSYNKYGKDNFDFIVIERYILNLIEREQYWMDLLKPDYNILPYAYKTQGVKRSEETKLKLRLCKLGVKKSEEHCKNIGLSKLGIKYKTGNRIKNIYQLDKEDNMINFYNSITQASEISGIGRTAINNCLKKLSNTAGGFKWRYSDGNN